MIGVYFIAFFVGFAAVMQAALNRQMGNTWGLASSILFNNVVVVVATFIFWLWVRSHSQSVSEYLRLKGTFSQFSPWYILPGLFGFCIVAGLPYAISKVGALKTFIVLIVSQTVVSLLWDVFFEGVEFSSMRAVGAGIAVLGALIAISY